MVWEVPVDFPRPSCASAEATNADCEERTINGIPVVLSTARGVGGAISYSATSARPDGTWVRVGSHNTVEYQPNAPGKEELGAPVTRPEPALGYDEIAAIATLPGLRF